MIDQNKSSNQAFLTFSNSKNFFLAFALAIFILAFSVRIIPGPRTIDDAFITFRYARNILAGNGFVYNPGEHALGTTTPLYTLLLAFIGHFVGKSQAPFPNIALAINALADGFTCLLLLDLGRRLGSALGGIAAALVWAVAPFSVTFAIGGLETSIYVLLLTSTMSAYLHRWYYLAAFLAALSLFTRPDAVLFLGPLIFDRLLQYRREIIKGKQTRSTGIKFWRNVILEILLFSVPLLTWISISTYFFGSPIPNSITAKNLAYNLPPTAALIRLIQHYATPFLGHQTFGILWIGVGIILYPFLFIIGAIKAIYKNKHIWPFVLYPWLYFSVFSIANPLIFRWYMTPPLPSYFLFILIGADHIINNTVIWLSNRINPETNNRSNLTSIFRIIAILIVVILPLALTLRDWVRIPDHGINRPAPAMAWYKLELLYQQAAQTLSSELNPESVLAAGDVGVLGYSTNVRILDTVGLTSAETLEYYPLDTSYYVINYAVPPDLILQNLPDFIVLLEVYGRNGLFTSQVFWENYTLLKKLPTDIYGSDGMLIFARKN
jgi:arabinofuranosyltransferase